MSPVVVGIIGLAFLFFFLAIRMPVGIAMALIGLCGFIFLVSSEGGLSMAARATWGQFASYHFSVVPLFILMGQFSFFSGISSRLYKSAYNWLGHMRGGLAMATIGACAGFAAICGSSTATTSAVKPLTSPSSLTLLNGRLAARYGGSFRR